MPKPSIRDASRSVSDNVYCQFNGLVHIHPRFPRARRRSLSTYVDLALPDTMRQLRAQVAQLRFEALNAVQKRNH
jgi:hypothetical protein